MLSTGFSAFSTALVVVAALSAPGVDASIRPTSFATKTAYWDQRPTAYSTPAGLFWKLEAEVEKLQLKLLQVQQVSRHGTRYPTDGNMEEIQAVLSLLQTNYSSDVPSWMANYSLPYNDSVAGELAPAGAAELAAYGTRSRSALGSKIPTAYNASKFILQHTYKSRTADSAKAFASTFFSNPEDVQYVEHSKNYDLTLRYFDACDRYNSEVADNSSAFGERDSFLVSSKFNESTAALKTKLNIPEDAELSTTDVQAAFAACAFDVSLYDIDSNWCTVMDQTFANHLEYADELETFYEQGPGYKINYEIAAVLLQDIFGYMKNFTTGETDIVGNFRFAHAETTLPLIVLLGYSDKTPLLASFTDDQINSRKFRSSALSPMATNIEFRLYQGILDKKYYVQILVQEVVAVIPGCGKVFCELSKLEELWSYYLYTYNFDAECAA